MNPEIKARWVEALRSGNYEQGDTYLRADDKFCCLGVLCDLAEAEGVVTSGLDPNNYATIYHSGGEGYGVSSGALPPRSVIEWAGLDSRSPIVEAGDEGRAFLTALNDGGTPFSEIADYIEASL